jgi:hypothetical protein
VAIGFFDDEDRVRLPPFKPFAPRAAAVCTRWALRADRVMSQLVNAVGHGGMVVRLVVYGFWCWTGPA